MFCPNCGKEIPAGKFCTYCGTPIPIVHTDAEKTDADLMVPQELPLSSGEETMQPKILLDDNPPQNAPIKNAYSKAPLIIGAIAIILLVGIAGFFLTRSDQRQEDAINIVRNGYLGCYTDVTVEKFVTYLFEMDGITKSITWDSGTTNNGDFIVEARSIYETLDGEDQKIRIQFKMMSEDTFAFNGLDDGVTDLTRVADILEFLNYSYFMYYWDELDMDLDTAVAKLNSCSYGAVLCGASASYTGDREYLYPEEFEIDPISATAADYLDLWGCTDALGEGESSNYYPEYTTVSPEIEAAYRPIIGSYSIALRDHYDMSMLESYGLNYLGIYHGFEDVGYVMQDVTGDGIPELIIGEINGTPGFFFDMYTVMNGEATLLVRSGERDRYYLCANGYLENQWSSGAAYSGVDYYQILWERANDQLYIDFELVESGEYERYSYVTFNFQPLPAI